MEKVCAIILAAGKGTRIGSTEFNKVTLQVGGQPIIQRNINVLKNAGIKDILVVVGFAKESVTRLLGPDILIAEQEGMLGTGHAVKIALAQIPENDNYVLVVYGDDAFWFTPEVLQKLYQTHLKSNADLTFCTTVLKNPHGLGRILRRDKQVVDIIEEKVATQEQKKIQEVNLGGYLISKAFLQKYIEQIPQNPVSKEYYLTDLIPLASKNGAKIETLTLENFKWRGINTLEELKQAEELLTT